MYIKLYNSYTKYTCICICQNWKVQKHGWNASIRRNSHWRLIWWLWYLQCVEISFWFYGQHVSSCTTTTRGHNQLNWRHTIPFYISLHMIGFLFTPSASKISQALRPDGTLNSIDWRSFVFLQSLVVSC